MIVFQSLVQNKFGVIEFYDQIQSEINTTCQQGMLFVIGDQKTSIGNNKE